MRMRRHFLVLVPLLLVVSGSCTNLRTCCPPEITPSVVSIDSQLNAHPDPVHVRRGQWMHFFLESGELNIEADFLDNQGHEGGQAWGRVRPDAALGHHAYRVVNLAAPKKADPEVMIDP